MDAARTRLGDAAFDLAWSEGRVLDQVTAIALGLHEPARATTGALARAAARHTQSSRGGSVRSPNCSTRGLSNKEIADSLFISPRTAETHVEHILTKLGFTNRTQVAAWIGDQVRTDEG